MRDDTSIAHIGIAVRDVSAALPFYQDVLGATAKPAERADGALILSLPFGDIDIELLEPQNDQGPVAKFIAKRGPGIHHICFRVPDLDATLQLCRDRGYHLVDDKPRIGAHGRRIAFLHPKSTSEILLEITE